MSASKLNIFEKWTTKGLPSLKEHAIIKLAIQLCQNNELKNDIIYESEPLRRFKHSITNRTWDNLFKKRLTCICEKLLLPPQIENLLIVRIMSVALQLFSWNRRQAIFNFSPLFADSLLTPSDWTIKMILDEKKIAERLVQDERIPVSQRYKMACLHCLQLSIHSLWDQISFESREDFLYCKESNLVRLWSHQLAGRVEELIHNEDRFWGCLLDFGLNEGSRATVLQCWEKFSISARRRSIVQITIEAVKMIKIRANEEQPTSFMYARRVSSPKLFIDNLCFLLAQMSEVQMAEFFQEALKDPQNEVLIYFIRWPFLDLLIPIVKKLWKFLPETQYERLLLLLAHHYTKFEFHYTKFDFTTTINRSGYVDYDYGRVIIELLEDTPAHFKRYLFSNNYHKDTHPVEKGKLILLMILNKILQFRNMRIFQQFLRHVTFEEKKSFLRSGNGALFCCYLALEEKWELLNSMLREYLSEKDIAIFKKQILRSEKGKAVCLEMLNLGNEEALNSWLNWGFSSKQEIFQFFFKLFFRNKCFRGKGIVTFGIELNCLDNIIKRYTPSEYAREKFKTQFAKKHSKNVCLYFIFNSKWQDIDPFLSWVFSSEGCRKRFKNWFVREKAIHICEYHLWNLNLMDAEKFLNWGFPSEEALLQFKQELFFFSGIMLQPLIYFPGYPDLDIFINWFRLNPEDILKFKKKVLFRSYALHCIFEWMSKFTYSVLYKDFTGERLERISIILKWALTDEETATSFKGASKTYLMDFSFSSIEVRQFVEYYWDKLITGILTDLSIKRKGIRSK